MEEYLIETEEYKGYVIKVYRDFNPESPREWGNLGTMVCFHRDYVLGDKHDLTPDELINIIKTGNVIALPLYLIDHSGLAMRCYSFRDVDPGGWDSGRVGYIYVTREKVLREYGKKRVSKALREKVIRVLRDEVEIYSKYLKGGVVGYIAGTPSGDHINSCWGYYEREHLMDDAKEVIDNYIKQLSANPM